MRIKELTKRPKLDPNRSPIKGRTNDNPNMLPNPQKSAEQALDKIIKK